MSVNVCGLLRHKDDIDILIREMKPDILCVSETHVSEDVLDHEIAFTNYNTIRANTNNNRTGGTVTYILKNFKYSILLNASNAIDGTWLTCIQIKNKIGTFNVCNLYRSPSSKISLFYQFILELSEQLLQSGKTIILGDFNMDVLTKNHYTSKLIDEMEYLGFKQKISSPTRTTLRSETIIDLVFSNFELMTNVLDEPKIADHNTISVKLIYETNDKNRFNRIKTRDYSKFDENRFQFEVKNKFKNLKYPLTNNNSAIDILEYNNLVKKITSDIINIIDDMAPMHNKLIKYKWIYKPWIDANTLELIKDRNEAFRKAKVTKKKIDISKYKMLRNNVVKLIKSNKLKHYETEIDGNKHCSKKLWKTLKQLIGEKKCYTGINEVIFGNEVCTDKIDIANRLNDYFIESINDIVENVKLNSNSLINDDNCDIVNFNIDNDCNSVINTWNSFNEVNFVLVNKVIQNLDCKKSKKNDINVYIVKLLWNADSNLMMYMMNTSLKLGVIPSEWK